MLCPLGNNFQPLSSQRKNEKAGWKWIYVVCLGINKLLFCMICNLHLYPWFNIKVNATAHYCTVYFKIKLQFTFFQHTFTSKCWHIVYNSRRSTMQRTQISINWQTDENPCKEACRQCMYLTSGYLIRETVGIYRGTQTDHYRHQN